MHQTLTLPETLYTRLQAAAQENGVDSLEDFIRQLVEIWESRRDEMHRRQEVVRRIDALRASLETKYGTMADSVVWIREDRER
ncbi:MAG: hypothetical protein N2556_00110 [Anaerolineae bacterium]|nr:hypothetical protein [Anaerolineae bacterium]